MYGLRARRNLRALPVGQAVPHDLDDRGGRQPRARRLERQRFAARGFGGLGARAAARLLLARRGRLRGVAFVVLLFVVLALGAALRARVARGGGVRYRHARWIVRLVRRVLKISRLADRCCKMR